MQELYAVIASTYTSFKFIKEAVLHIGCMNKNDLLEVKELEDATFLAVALSSGIEDFDYFIAIFPPAFSLISNFCLM